MGGGLCTSHFDLPRVPKVLKNEEPAHTKRILMPLKPGLTPAALKLKRRPPKLLCLLARQSDSELTWYSPAAVCFCTAPQSCGTLLLHLHAAQRRRASEPSKWRPGPATSWPGRVARRAPRRMSDTSRQVTYSPQCRIEHTNTVHKHNVASTLVVQWLARPCGLHEIVSSILGYT